MSALQPRTGTTFDVVCVGNAIVDVLAQVEDSFLDRHSMVKGSMQLIEPSLAAAIYAEMPPAVEMSGGSAANTAAGLASLGSSVAFIGKVADDELGGVFAHDISAAGVTFAKALARGESAAAGTARCLVLVTGDAERTLNTSLGVSGTLTPDEVDLSVVTSASVLYCEGYLWDSPDAKAAIRRAMDAAREAGVAVAFTLSDGFCVDRHRDEFLELIETRVDILFANESEICSLYRVDRIEEAEPRVTGHCPIACLTRSERGSLILTADGGRHEIAVTPVTTVDTTGAGDLYAAGFLAGWTRGESLAESGRMASVAAAEAVSHLGARPQTPLDVLVAAGRSEVGR